MANNEAPVYAWTAETEEDASKVFLTFAGMSVAEFLTQARAATARLSNEVVEQKDKVDLQVVELQAKDETITSRNREIKALHETIAAKNEAIAQGETALNNTNFALTAAESKVTELAVEAKTLNEKLAFARMAAAKAPKGVERTESGGIRLMVTLDVDEATPLLSWAESADEDPAEYITRQVHDALVAVTSS